MQPCQPGTLCADAWVLRRIGNDVLLMRDVYPLTVLVGYQFHTRWPGAHVMYLRKGSPLSARLLRTLRAMPLDHPSFKEEIVEQARPSFAISPYFPAIESWCKAWLMGHAPFPCLALLQQHATERAQASRGEAAVCLS